ncbi:Hypothetical protein SCLAV_3165 [Streptomyces clavuligerus]|uniref:Uncharacterized protein n=1 Tax=Streptomyces clavuligerus TaxID=1901 RepID=E2PXZ6_STRCL|nr:Hypothetical protein SCLAV_3165 [Streptomyces clavuligerus]
MTRRASPDTKCPGGAAWRCHREAKGPSPLPGGRALSVSRSRFPLHRAVVPVAPCRRSRGSLRTPAGTSGRGNASAAPVRAYEHGRNGSDGKGPGTPSAARTAPMRGRGRGARARTETAGTTVGPVRRGRAAPGGSGLSRRRARSPRSSPRRPPPRRAS